MKSRWMAVAACVVLAGGALAARPTSARVAPVSDLQRVASGRQEVAAAGRDCRVDKFGQCKRSPLGNCCR